MRTTRPFYSLSRNQRLSTASFYFNKWQRQRSDVISPRVCAQRIRRSLKASCILTHKLAQSREEENAIREWRMAKDGKKNGHFVPISQTKCLIKKSLCTTPEKTDRHTRQAGVDISTQ